MQLSKKLIYQVIAEEPKAVLQFYRLVQPKITLFFQDKIASPEDRQEVIQDTLLSIFDSLPQFAQKCQFTTWMRTIASHELVDYYRRKKIKTLLFSHFPALEYIIDKALGPQLALEEKELKHKIFKTFKKLSEGNTHILRLRYMDGLSVAEIAQTLDITYKAAESKLSRARLAFQKAYIQSTVASKEVG